MLYGYRLCCMIVFDLIVMMPIASHESNRTLLVVDDLLYMHTNLPSYPPKFNLSNIYVSYNPNFNLQLSKNNAQFCLQKIISLNRHGSIPKTPVNVGINFMTRNAKE